MTMNRVIVQGLLVIHGPATVCVLGAPVLAFAVAWVFKLPAVLVWLVAGAVVGLAAGWLWWSWRAPKWRLWALSNITGGDADEFEWLQVAALLVWPEDFFLTRTEIRGADYDRRRDAAELLGVLRRLTAGAECESLPANFTSLINDLALYVKTGRESATSRANLQDLRGSSIVGRHDRVEELLQALSTG